MFPIFDLSLQLNGFPIKEAKAELRKIVTLSNEDHKIFIENKKLPTGLDQLKDQVPYLNAAALKDPISGQPYMYKRNSDTEYELCASFKTDNTKPGDIQDYSYADRWPHVSGDQCLKQKIAPIGNDATMKNLQMINQ